MTRKNPYTETEQEILNNLIDYANLAQELFDVDELEEYAEELRELEKNENRKTR